VKLYGKNFVIQCLLRVKIKQQNFTIFLCIGWKNKKILLYWLTTCKGNAVNCWQWVPINLEISSTRIQRYTVSGPRTSKNSAVFLNIQTIWLFSNYFYFLGDNLKVIFLVISMRPARPFFESHAARESLWVWDPWSRG
jgi:hypothetical protein